MSNVYLEILKKYWGYPSFRPLQEDIIRSVADDKKDTLGLLPTGGGKSIIYQVPGLAMEGITLVISPLIALMKDQVENLQKRKIKAKAIYSGLSQGEILNIIEEAINGELKFLYLSPERLETRLFLENLENLNVNLIAVDEAHCISQWGYDFRPSYLKIANIREYLPQVPVLALTATATPKVVDDIQEKLKFREKNVFRKSFKRENLIYLVKKTDDKIGALLRLVKKIKGSGVIYLRSRKKVEKIAKFLQSHNISADFYHAGLELKEKDRKQEEWKKDKIRIIVATNAFGMGIDKPDVRFVIHLDLPDSLEAYFQEAGRGGRDQKEAFAFLIYNNSDIINLRKSVETSFPPKEEIKKIYNAICNYFQLPIGSGKGRSFPFKLEEFALKYNLKPLIVFNSLKFLQKEGYLEFSEEINEKSKLKIIVSNAELYKFQVEHPDYEYFIKLLLRNYPGIIGNYVQINEFFLADKFKVDVKIIKSILQKLDNYGIVHYVPYIKSSFITFLEERIAPDNFLISTENYDFLKQRYIEHIEAVINYVTEKEKCRSQILLEYFGEYDSEECGKCDVCYLKKKNYIPKSEKKSLEKQIIELLKKEPQTINNLVEKLNFAEDKIIETVRQLLDNQTIEHFQTNKLKLKE